jgi:serine/threonine-protein kinase ULK/ATG1
LLNFFSFRIPSGTSKELTDLLLGLLKRNAKDRLEFDVFFNHPFIRAAPERTVSPQPTPTPPVAVPMSPPKQATPVRQASQSPASGLPPSPVVMGGGLDSGRTPPVASPSPKVTPHRTANVVIAATARQAPEGSSPDAEDFVMVPEQLTMDAAEVRRTQLRQPAPKPSPGGRRRHTVSWANPANQNNPSNANNRPSSLPVTHMEPQPVPAQRNNYNQIQQSLTRSRSKSGDSVSAMSGVSSASGGSTLGPLPEEGVAPGPSPGSARRERASSTGSPRTPTKSNALVSKVRKVSGPPIPDICQLSPPPLQYTMGTPPLGHRRRTSSSSSCGTPPPNLQWAITPNPTSGRISSAAGTAVSPIRGRAGTNPGNNGSQTNLFSNIPCLSPILGSPNKTETGAAAGTSGAIMPWRNPEGSMSGSRTVTVPEDLCNLAAYTDGATSSFRRRSAEMQFAGGRNVVLNYGQSGTGVHPIFERSGSLNSLTRRHSGKENLAPIEHEFAPPPGLSEETLLAPEHNEILAKLKFINQYVDTIIEVARHKAAPLNSISESISPRNSSPKLGELEPNSPTHRRVQQLLLYMRCMHLLSQCMDFARAEMKSKRLKPSTTVKTGEKSLL